MQSSILAKLKVVEQSDTFGVFEAEPFEKTFGTTIGNAFRRVLLSSLPGVAVTSIRIKGVSHEFSTIKGLKEDVLDFILNIKQIRIRKLQNFDKSVSLNLDIKGQASDFSELFASVQLLPTKFATKA